MTELFQDPALVLLLLFVIPLALRVPIAICLGLSASIVAWMYDMGIDMLPYNFFAGVAKVPLLAIPFFILAGFIMERAGIAARIVHLSRDHCRRHDRRIGHCNRCRSNLLGCSQRIGPRNGSCVGINFDSGDG